MIARIWHGKVPENKSEAYHQYLLKTGLHDYSKTKGNRGVFLFKKDESGITHFYTLSLWNDIENIKEFAGEDYKKARYYPEDQEFLLEFEPLVEHYDILEIFHDLNNDKNK